MPGNSAALGRDTQTIRRTVALRARPPVQGRGHRAARRCSARARARARRARAAAPAARKLAVVPLP